MNCLRALAFLFSLAVFNPLMAQEPPPEAEAPPAVSDSHREAARTLIEQLRLEELLARSLEANLDAQIELNPRLADYTDVMRAFLEKYVGWDAVKDDIVRIYTEAFSEAEIREMIAFYETPTGRKAVEILPGLMEKGRMLGQKRVQDNVFELQEALAKRQAELEAAAEEEPEKP